MVASIIMLQSNEGAVQARKFERCIEKRLPIARGK